MAWVVFLFGSGYAFFIGALLIVGGVANELGNVRWLRVWLWVVILGIILICASAAPVPIWAFAFAGFTSLLWFLGHTISASAWQAQRRRMQIAMLAVWTFITTSKAVVQVV